MRKRMMRLGQIIGDGEHDGVFPVSRSAWYRGIRDGLYPEPVKVGGSSLWRASDIEKLLDRISEEVA